MPIAELSTVKRAFVIGSFLRKDHPLVATRLRAAVKGGAKLSILHASDDELLIPTANKMIAAPSDWLAALSEIVVGRRRRQGRRRASAVSRTSSRPTPPRPSPPACRHRRRPAGR